MIRDHHPEDGCTQMTFVHSLGVIRYRHPNIQGVNDPRLCALDKQTWPCETVTAIDIAEGIVAVLADVDREASLAHDMRTYMLAGQRSDLDAVIWRIHDLLRPMLVEAARPAMRFTPQPEAPRPCERGSNRDQGIAWHWCTVHNAEFLLSAKACAAIVLGILVIVTGAYRVAL